MKSFASAVFVFSLLFTTASYAQSLDNRGIAQRLDRLEENIQLIQRQLALSDGTGDGKTANPGAARLAVEIGEMEDDMRAIRGQIEDNEFKIRQLTEKLERLQKDVDFRLREIKQKPLSAKPSAQPSGGGAGAPLHTAETGTEDGAWQGAEETDEASEDAPPSPSAEENGRKPVNEAEKPAPAKPEFASARDHYNHAFRLMNQAKYEEASESFGSFVEVYPKDALVGNAYYWLGETYYVRQDYLKAADRFRQGFEAQPAGPKASDNLLKLAMSLGALDKKPEACVVLKQVIAKFGSTSSTAKQKAEAETARMGCKAE